MIAPGVTVAVMAGVTGVIATATIAIATAKARPPLMHVQRTAARRKPALIAPTSAVDAPAGATGAMTGAARQDAATTVRAAMATAIRIAARKLSRLHHPKSLPIPTARLPLSAPCASNLQAAARKRTADQQWSHGTWLA